MKKIHLIGNAHLDPVWLWQWQEGFAEIKATYRSALDRIREFDDFVFEAHIVGDVFVKECFEKIYAEHQIRDTERHRV